ncbi:MAG: cytochrome-c peroxidase [Phycisphaerae bacterium]
MKPVQILVAVALSFTILLASWGVPGCKKQEGASAPGAAPGEAAAPAGRPTGQPTSRPAAPMARLPIVPAGLPPVPVPADNPMSVEKVELGKALYFEKRLSKDGTVSCATCHDPATAWTEHRATSEGIGNQLGGRNSPTVINAAYMPVLFWDGRAKSLEEQALGPIENPVEMGNKMEAVVVDLGRLPGYKERFKAVFGSDEITKERVAQAIAAFERTILSGDSPYDRHVAGDPTAMTEAQKRGLAIFTGKGTCDTCHTPPLFSNGRFYNAGVDAAKPNPDEGRKKVTGEAADMGKFRVPPLREVANTYPYFHDGSAKTLEEAVALMAGGGRDNPNLSPVLKSVRDARITEQEQKDLVEFLKALSGKYPVTEAPKLPS